MMLDEGTPLPMKATSKRCNLTKYDARVCSMGMDGLFDVPVGPRQTHRCANINACTSVYIQRVSICMHALPNICSMWTKCVELVTFRWNISWSWYCKWSGHVFENGGREQVILIWSSWYLHDVSEVCDILVTFSAFVRFYWLIEVEDSFKQTSQNYDVMEGVRGSCTFGVCDI